MPGINMIIVVLSCSLYCKLMLAFILLTKLVTRNRPIPRPVDWEDALKNGLNIF